MSLSDVTIYTDGACDPNPGPGGWAAILIAGEHQKELTGQATLTTNNRMELQAVIEALEALKRPCQVRLHTDSRYVQRGITEWLPAWKAKHWKGVQNRDLWERLDQAQTRHTIDWQWVKGHADNPLNIRADELAVSMIPHPTLPVDDPEAAHIFTGVSCLGQTGPGGWAAVIRTGQETRSVVGQEAQTSANRLHLLAALKGLEAAAGTVHVYTPSDYAANGVRQWAAQWAAQGWRTRDGEPVKHAELWQSLIAQGETRPVHWHCLKDQIHPAESAHAETLARQAARSGQ